MISIQTGRESTSMDRIPETGYLRLRHIIGDRFSNPPQPAIVPVSKSTWWEGVKQGRFPKPIKIGPRITAWRAEDIRELILSISGDDR